MHLPLLLIGYKLRRTSNQDYTTLPAPGQVELQNHL